VSNLRTNTLFMRSLYSFVLALVLSIPLAGIAQNPGDSLYGSATVHTIHFNFPQTGYWDSLASYFTLDKYLECDVTVDGTLLPSSGVKFKGNSSYNNPSDKKSFKVDLNEFVSGQEYDNIKKFNLNNGFKDPTFMREKIMLDFCRSKGMPAPRCTYANVYINNQHWGLYMLIEEINNAFLEQIFGNKDGNLFKGDPSGDLKWLGSTLSSYYSKYELHTNETANDWTDLVNLIDKINNTPAADLQDSLDAVLNTYGYLSAWAASNLFVNLDSYMGSGHNYFIYHNDDDKFHWIIWDVNEAFGNFNMGMTIAQLEGLSLFHIPNPATNRPLNNKLVQDAYYKSILVYIACEYLHNGFTTTELYPKIDSIANVIRPHVYADPKKFYTSQQFEDNINTNLTGTGGPGGGNIPGLKSFIANRRTALFNELLAHGCYVGVEDTEPKESLSAFPNPFTNTIMLAGTFDNEAEVKLYSITGSELLARSIPIGTVSRWMQRTSASLRECICSK
jgi:spore coat protein H